jgi:hypothetical protein
MSVMIIISIIQGIVVEKIVEMKIWKSQ